MIPVRNIGIIWRMFALRYWIKQPFSTFILILIIALGVSTFLSIRMANRAAISNFQLFSEVISDGSDWVIHSDSGFLSSEDLRLARVILGPDPVFILPILETTITPLASDTGELQRSYRLVASDSFALRNLLYETGKTNTTAFQSELGRDANTIPAIITSDIANRFSLKPGDEFKVFLQDQQVTLLISALFNDAVREEQSLSNLVFTDIRKVQLLLNQEGLYQRFELVVPEGAMRDTLVESTGPKISNSTPDHWQISRLGEANNSTTEMTEAFRLNLIVLSLISLLVCIYLILQGLDASVVRRRKEIATMRSLGMSEKDIYWGWLFEAAILGLIGSILGVALGGALAQLLVRQIANTVNTLYRTTSADYASLQTSDLVIGLSLGVLLSLVSAYLPAKDAASTPPAQVLAVGNTGSGPGFFSNLWIGGIGMGIAILLFFMPPIQLSSGNPFPLFGYASAILSIIGSTWFAVFLFKPTSKLISKLFKSSAPGVSGAARLRLRESRQILAVAGLVVAISMAGGMSILVASFEKTMLKWVDYTFDADLFISSKSARSGDAFNRITSTSVVKVRSLPFVKDVIPFAQYPISLNERQTFIAGTLLENPLKLNRYIWIGKKPFPTDFSDVSEPFSCIINESFANHFGLAAGDQVSVHTPSGDKQLRIRAIHSDYSTDRGLITIPIRLLNEWFKSNNVTNLSVYLAEGANAIAVNESLAETFPALTFLSNRDLRITIRRIFQDTFAVTQSIKWLGLIISMSGLALSLFCILIETRNNLTIYKHLGMGRLGVAKSTAVEGLGLSLIGIFTGIALSIYLGSLLIFVINKQSFGWTLQYHFPLGDLLLFSSVILLVGWIVSFGIGYFHRHEN